MTTPVQPAQPSADILLDDATQRRLFLNARSPWLFADKPVPTSLIQSVYEWIRWGPTANNTVPLRIALLESADARAKLLELSKPGNVPKFESAPLIIIAASDTRYHEFSEQLLPGNTTERESLELDETRRLRSSHMNGALQIGYLVVGLRAAGLAVRPIGGFDKHGVDDYFFAGTGWKSEVALIVGYPVQDGDDGSHDRRPRLDFDQASRVF